MSESARHRVCFISGTRYAQPLTTTESKKFEGLARTSDLNIVAFSRDMWPRRFNQHGRFYLLPAPPLSLLRYVLLFSVAPIVALWCVVRHRSNVIVAQSPYEGCIGAWAKQLARLAMRRPVALIVESHGDFERALFLQRRITRRRVYEKLMAAAAGMALRHADVLRAISTATREQLRRLGVTQPIVDFPTWSNIDLFVEAGKDRSSTGREVVYAGVLTPLKGVHHLIAAFARIAVTRPDARLHLIGGSPDQQYRDDLERQIAALGISEVVVFGGQLPQEHLVAKFKAARVLVLPSHSEGLGRVLFEAMATGTPVIGTTVGGIPDLIEHGVNGFLVGPGDEIGLAGAIATLLDDADLSTRLGAAGRKFVTERFSTERYFTEYERLFTIAEDAVLAAPEHGHARA